MTFLDVPVRKPLAAVSGITEKGNVLRFGPGVEDNYIFNPSSGEKDESDGKWNQSYLMEVEFVGGGKTKQQEREETAAAAAAANQKQQKKQREEAATKMTAEEIEKQKNRA